MSNDSELESLQCYPFHLPEPPLRLRFTKGRSGLVELLRVPAEPKPRGLWLLPKPTEEEWQKALGDSERWERLMRTGTYMSFKAGDDE